MVKCAKSMYSDDRDVEICDTHCRPWLECENQSLRSSLAAKEREEEGGIDFRGTEEKKP